MLKVWNIKRVSEHLLFWIAYWIMISFFQGLYQMKFGIILISSLTQLPLKIISTYFFIYFVLPYLYKKKVLFFIILSIVVLSCSVLLQRLSMAYIQYPLFYADSGYSFEFWDWYRIGGHIVQTIEVIGIVSAVKYYRDWTRNKSKIEALTNEKLEAELNFLKAQVHPHFLFNTLNSIYYEVLNKTDKAADLLVQLSDLLRFTLYECRDDFIKLEKEIKIIENYIEIEKSRYGKRLKVNANFKIQKGVMVPPLILFSLVENSFKHGVSDRKGVSEIDIIIKIENNKVILDITNPVSKPGTNDNLGAKDGIGLDNTVRQLKIIYDSKYSLNSQVVDNKYNCILEIPISDQ